MPIRKILAVAALVLCLAGLASCAGAKSGPMKESDFASSFRAAQSGVSKDWSNCIAKQLYTDNPKPLQSHQRREEVAATGQGQVVADQDHGAQGRRGRQAVQGQGPHAAVLTVLSKRCAGRR